MRLVTFAAGSADRIGVVDAGHGTVRDASELLGSTDLVAVIERWDTSRAILVNGERRQLAPVKDLIFDIPTLIETISAGITLLPGDVIATGTPAGVGIGFDPSRFLTSGDVVEVSITRLGALRNRIA
jgi:2-keto-4-pentenoate hydratase/2-oxohepta-3-ene-1,7-dioic acid hydratase in catechol pathway